MIRSVCVQSMMQRTICQEGEDVPVVRALNNNITYILGRRERNDGKLTTRLRSIQRNARSVERQPFSDFRNGLPSMMTMRTCYDGWAMYGFGNVKDIRTILK